MGLHIGDNYAAVTQLGECKTEDLEVAGSSPARGTIHFFGLTASIGRGLGKMDVVIMDVDDPSMTLSEIMQMVSRFQSEHPELDVYLDGDRRAIMGRPHSVQESLER